MLSRDRVTWDWHGVMVMTIIEHDGLCPEVLGAGRCRCRPYVERVRVGNIITNVGKNLVRDGLIGAIPTSQITYCALGNGTATGGGAPAITDTQLAAESFRKIMTKNAAGVIGEAIATCYIAPSEGLSGGGVITEMGWFGGSSATGATNSGVMVSRLAWSHTKTVLESLQCEHHDTF